MIAGILFGFLPLAIWLYLLLFHNGFWLLRERDTLPVSEPVAWPPVVAVVPARDEAEVIQRSIGSLIAQDYPGSFRIVLVDDQSSDGTGDLARALASDRLTVLAGAPRPEGWTGKLWAMKQGSDHAACFQKESPEFLWFTDPYRHNHPTICASWWPRPGRRQGAGVADGRLSLQSSAEHFLIPGFVFFFDMLFPFGAVNIPHRTGGRGRRLHAGAAQRAGKGGRD